MKKRYYLSSLILGNICLFKVSTVETLEKGAKHV